MYDPNSGSAGVTGGYVPGAPSPTLQHYALAQALLGTPVAAPLPAGNQGIPTFANMASQLGQFGNLGQIGTPQPGAAIAPGAPPQMPPGGPQQRPGLPASMPPARLSTY